MGKNMEENLPILKPARTMIAEQEWKEYSSGFVAAVFNIFVTFPINKTMFRQMVDGISLKEAVGQLRREGARHVYRGIGPPLLQKSISTSLMFGTYTQYQRILRGSGIGMSAGQAKVCSAFMAGCTEAVLCPLERVQVLLQDRSHARTFKNTPYAFHYLRTHYGFREYYRGLSAVLLRNGPSNIIFFTSREYVQAKLPHSVTKSTKMATDFVSGALIGAIISTMFYPVNVTKTHMQLKCGEKFSKFSTVFRELLAERGLRGMFKGVHVNYTRSFLSWGIINVSYEVVLKQLNSLSM